MSNVIRLPKYNGPKVRRRKFSKTPAVVLRLDTYRAPAAPQTARDLYDQAYAIDENPADYEKAAGLYLKCLQVNPNYAIAYTNLGNIRFRQRDQYLAESLYKRALELEPDQPEANYNLGYLHFERGSTEDLPLAETHLRRAIASDPKFADAWFNLGMLLEQIGKPLQAAHAFRQYTRLEPVGSWSDIARRHY